MNTPVNFELAKLLKEKGFDESCSQYYVCQINNHFKDFNGKFYTCECKNEDGYVIGIYKRNNSIGQPHILMAPIISDVVMWLYEKHGIWISLFPKDICKDEWIYVYEFGVFQGYFKETIYSFKLDLEPFDSPTEAYEKAIEYCLTKLI